uniref:Uncharacterized protein LOC104237914 n=1 Tax=Nicotiana sylvestris TaxID=4096 RepID=A0A1U7XU61_NICSY|nr:PREDICTED: uncharacterized protein LOC104237914 [Nicotiana sylvestris]
MRRLLETRTDDPSTRRATPFGLVPMAVYEVGNGRHRSPTVGTRKVNKFFEDHKIKKILSTPYHHSENRHANSTNKTNIQNLKKWLTHAKGKLNEILPEVLWACRTTSKSSTRATPFSLVYGAEALIPVEVGELSLKFQYPTKESNSEAMIMIPELLDKRNEAALVPLAAQK